MDVCVVGGGMMGLSTAYYLTKSGVNVTIIEKSDYIGGLSRSIEIMPGLRWDQYYHVILTTDDELINLLNEIGLSFDIEFRATKTGFFSDGRLHSMSNIMEFFKFRPLSLLDKLRLGGGIIFASKIISGNGLDKIYAKTWLIRVFGRRNYKKFWDPLLRSKLGSASSKSSGAFIWAIIKRYYGTRHRGSKQEFLGSVRGGYHAILSGIEEKLKKNAVKIILDYSVEKLEPLSDGKLRIRGSCGMEMTFDKVVATIPNPAIIPLLPLQCEELQDRLRMIDYLNLVCVVLVLRNFVCPFYITNITDPGFPFTGLIDATNIIPEKTLDNLALVYLPRWMSSDDTFFKLKDFEVIDQFIKGLQRIFPDFSKKDVVSACVHRETNVQPVQTVNYNQKIGPMETSINGFFIVNTTMIRNSTLNNNEVVKLAKQAAELVAHDN